MWQTGKRLHKTVEVFLFHYVIVSTTVLVLYLRDAAADADGSAEQRQRPPT
jgi:hypothetical protein